MATNNEGTTLIDQKAMSANQMKVVNAIIEYHNGETKLTQKQLIEANNKLYGKIYGPYFIIKNSACKSTKEKGIYNLGVLKLSAAAKKAAEAPAVTEPDAPPAKKAKKVAASKPAKKAAKKSKKAPAPTEPLDDTLPTDADADQASV